MADNNDKLSLNIGSIDGTTASSGFVDVQASGVGGTIGHSRFGGTGGLGGLTKPPQGSHYRSDVILNDSITRDSTGKQTSNADPDTYPLA